MYEREVHFMFIQFLIFLLIMIIHPYVSLFSRCPQYRRWPCSSDQVALFQAALQHEPSAEMLVLLPHDVGSSFQSGWYENLSYYMLLNAFCTPPHARICAELDTSSFKIKTRMFARVCAVSAPDERLQFRTDRRWPDESEDSCASGNGPTAEQEH